MTPTGIGVMWNDFVVADTMVDMWMSPAERWRWIRFSDFRRFKLTNRKDQPRDPLLAQQPNLQGEHRIAYLRESRFRRAEQVGDFNRTYRALQALTQSGTRSVSVDDNWPFTATDRYWHPSVLKSRSSRRTIEESRIRNKTTELKANSYGHHVHESDYSGG